MKKYNILTIGQTGGPMTTKVEVCIVDSYGGKTSLYRLQAAPWVKKELELKWNEHVELPLAGLLQTLRNMGFSQPINISPGDCNMYLYLERIIEDNAE
jgi:hypothetical protein